MEDIILRDYVLSAASTINCAGGSNGRDVAVLKPWVIDLELPMGQQGASGEELAA
jgi:hypothetical protein